jgi:hypothetical protein
MLKNKAINASNSFRKMFGFPPIETGEIGHGKVTSLTDIHGGLIRIMPFVPEGGRPTHVHVEGPMRPGNGWRGRAKGGERLEVTTVYPNGPISYHHQREPSFFVRIQNAIMSLGPWEGRAVAFVLGCGIGVLLRMFFVLSIVLYRSLRGSEDEHEYEEVLVFEVDENESRRSAPPAYVYPVDEKVAGEVPVQA